MEKEIMQKELISAYDDVFKTSQDLITAQKVRIEQLEDEVQIHKEAVVRLMVLLDDAIAIAKKHIPTTHILTPTLN